MPLCNSYNNTDSTYFVQSIPLRAFLESFEYFADSYRNIENVHEHVHEEVRC